MILWKVEIFANGTDTVPERWGLMVAASEQEATERAMEGMGDEKRVDLTRISLSEIDSLPKGTFFWAADGKSYTA